MNLRWMVIVLGASCAVAGSGFAQADSTSLTWPEPTVHGEKGGWDVHDIGVLGVGIVVPLDVRARVSQQAHTPQEWKNIQAALDDQSRPRSAPRSVSKAFRPPTHSGFYVLHGAFGWPEKNGYAGYSFMSHVVTVEDIIAKGNRVVILHRTTGAIAGPMYGFKGIGQLMDGYEALHYEFDDDSLITHFEPWSGEDLEFYAQLGGTLRIGRDTHTATELLSGPSITKAQPEENAASALQEMLRGQTMTSQERKNIDTVFAAAKDGGGFDKPSPRFFARGYHNVETSASPFSTLAAINGGERTLRLASIKDLRRQVTDVIPDGDRLWAHILVTGVQTGKLFGADPTGIPLRWNEELYLTFDKDGKISESQRFPSQGEIYLELGGLFSFPYAQYWSCHGCPFGEAHLAIP